MNSIEMNISELLRRLNVRPNLEGYPYLIRVIEIAVFYYGKSFPKLKNLCIQTGAYFQVDPERVKYSVRMLLRNFWNQKNSLIIFQSVLDSANEEMLSPKEFISVISQYIAIHR